MPKVNYPLTNFTGGEVSPKLRGRVDIPPVQNGAETIINGICVAQGGVLRRWGKAFVAEVKDSTKRTRLIPFVFNNDQAYMIEVGDSYARFYNQDGAQILDGVSPYEIATPYNTAQILEVDYTQGGDTMFLLHQGVAPYRLQRFADDLWVFAAAPFTSHPIAELGVRPATTLTLSSEAVGSRTFTAGAAAFFESDIGRAIYSASGIGEITAYISDTVVTVAVTQAFESTSLSSGEWVIDGSPLAYAQPSAKSPAGGIITVTITTLAGSATQTITGLAFFSGTVTVTTSVPHGFMVGQTVVVFGNDPPEYNGSFTITAVPLSTTFQYATLDTPGTASTFGTAELILFTGAGGFRTGDVGKYLRINGGLVKITAYVSTTTVNAEIVQDLTSTVSAPPYAWTIEESVWSTVNGWPRTGTLYQQRLWLAGSAGYPLTVWGSALAESLEFVGGPLATDPVSYLVSTDRYDPILHITHCKALVALTGGGEFTFAAGSKTALGPTNVPKIDEQSNYGAKKIAPERVGNELFFVQAGGNRIRAMSPDQYDQRNYGAFDMSALAEHLYRVGIEQIAYQKDPEPLLWHVLADGRIGLLSVDREQSLIATSQIITDGIYEDVATLPTGDGEQTWVIVNRTINGVTKRYIERFVPGLHTDSAITGTSGPGSAVWTGLDHLEGKTVDCVADGVDMGQFTVTGGSITLPRLAYAVEIGLNYVTRIKTLTPEIGTGSGSSQGDNCKINKVTIRLLETIGGELDGTQLQARRLVPANLDAPLAPYTGDVQLTNLGWEKGVAQLEITQSRPMPFHLLAVFYKITVNEG
ncbi:phage tail protein [Arenimonas alkanexedens]